MKMHRKKRIFTILLTVLLSLSVILPISAEDSTLYIIDQRGSLTAFIPEFNAKASAIADTYDFNVSCLLAESTGGQGVVAYSEQIYQACYGDTDGIMLIESIEDQDRFLYKSGAAKEILTTEDEDALWEVYDIHGYYDEAVDAYLYEAQAILEEKTGIPLDLDAVESSAEAVVPEVVTDTETDTTEDTETGVVSNEIPETRLQNRVVDDADLLETVDEKVLLKKLNEISERQECDVVVVTVEGMDGKTAAEYADDFYAYNGYGFGENRDGILLLVSMEDRDWYMSTCGYGITAFTDAGREYMADQFLPMLSDGDYNGAFTKYAELCDDFISQAKTGEPYDTGNLPKGSVSPIWILGDLIIGFVIAFILGTKKKSNLKSVRTQKTAQDYAVPGSMVLTVNWDHLVNKVVTTRVIQKNNNSSGSSTHTSSSGTTHGGSGGKF